MSQRTDSVFVSSLGKGDTLHQQVLAAFPLCGISEEDLIQNPQFCKLLATLSQHVDRTGLTQHLRRDREKVRALTLMHTSQPQAVEFHFSSANSALFCSMLEQCLMVAQCVKQMDVSSDSTEDHSGILGLTAERVQRQMPPEQVLQMKQRLPSELLQHLKKKAVSVLTYYQPEWENESEGLRSVKLSKLPELLDAEQKRAKSLTEKNRENETLLQRQTHAQLSVSPEKPHACLQVT
uniref:HAUS augmin-like complex, subunit 7 n=1 Tax=Sinocyclocheilus grahami TaxID=75366 RepID=A0A672K9P9_SINGR